MLRALTEGAGGFQAEVTLVAGGDPGDDGQGSAAGAAENGRLKTHELEALPSGVGSVHHLEAHPVFDADEIDGALATDLEPIGGERPTAPSVVRGLHPHAETGPAKVRMIRHQGGAEGIRP